MPADPPSAGPTSADPTSAGPTPADPNVLVNGEPRDAAGRTVSALVVDLGLPPDGRGVAVAIAGEVVPRGGWADRTLRAGEQVEVLTAMQGG